MKVAKPSCNGRKARTPARRAVQCQVCAQTRWIAHRLWTDRLDDEPLRTLRQRRGVTDLERKGQILRRKRAIQKRRTARAKTKPEEIPKRTTANEWKGLPCRSFRRALRLRVQQRTRMRQPAQHRKDDRQIAWHLRSRHVVRRLPNVERDVAHCASDCRRRRQSVQACEVGGPSVLVLA